MARSVFWFATLAGLVSTAAFAQAPGRNDDAALSDLLKAQTQAFSEAGQRGDAQALARYLDPDVVFTNETGDIVTAKDIVDGASPSADAASRHIEVTNWALKRQGAVATATFIDVLTQDFHGARLVYHFQSTETWAKRADGWRMIASHTMNLVGDPPSISLPAADLAAYVGVYQLDPAYRVEIRLEGGQLTSSTNGAAATPLKAEIRDVLFTPGVPTGRRIFLRDPAGRITGFISRRNGADLQLKKVA
jgi:ketosteroid isomerase-like protein